MRIFLLFLVALFAFGEEIVITKYLEDKPSIDITFKGPRGVKKILDMDLKVIDHFNLDKNSTKKIEFSYRNRTLKVTYKLPSKTITKIYKTNSRYYYPFLVHKAVYDLNRYFELPDVKFITRKVVYALMNAPKDVSIYLADYSLSYKKRIIRGGMNIFPKWTDDSQTAIYYTKLGRYATLYKLDLRTGKKIKLLSSQGLLIVSDVKGNNLLITIPKNGNTDVYQFNVKTKQLTRITKYPGIDVNGKFWGDKIAFVSDRYGLPYVFSKDLKSGRISRVFYHGKNQVGVDAYKDYLVVSSRESSKAFSKNTFNLFLMNANDESVKRLTMSGQNNFANFSVDGTSIMFIKRENFRSKIGIIRLNENKIFYYNLKRKLQSFDW